MSKKKTNPDATLQIVDAGDEFYDLITPLTLKFDASDDHDGGPA